MPCGCQDAGQDPRDGVDSVSSTSVHLSHLTILPLYFGSLLRGCCILLPVCVTGSKHARKITFLASAHVALGAFCVLECFWVF